jgi:hypothetical protein
LYAPSNIDLTIQQYVEELNRTDRLKLTITPVISLTWTDTQFSNIVITGLTRYANCRPIVDHANWASIDIVVTDNGLGVYTVTLGLDGIVFASGSRTGNGHVIISDVDDYGVDAELDLNFTIGATSQILIHYPSAYKIHMRKDVPFTPADFPRTAGVTILDVSRATYYYRSDVLAAGTWYVVIHQIPDSGLESTTANNQSIVVDAVPAVAGRINYMAGDSSATVVGFQASTTPGATYAWRDSGVSPSGGCMSEQPDYSSGAGAGLIMFTLPSLGAHFTGYRGIWLQAVSGGIEDGGNNTLLLQYIDGDVVNVGIPPGPTINKVTFFGRTITVSYMIDTRLNEFDQITMPVAAALFMFQLPGSPDYQNPSVQGWVSQVIGNFAIGSLSFTVPSDGNWYFVLRSMAYDSTQSLNVDSHGPYVLDLVPGIDPVFTVVPGS